MTRVDVAAWIRNQANTLGHVPHATTTAGLQVTCPGCGRQATVHSQDLGKRTYHVVGNCRAARRCGERFILDPSLEGYVYRGERIGTVAWEQKSA